MELFVFVEISLRFEIFEFIQTYASLLQRRIITKWIISNKV
jgi:hypothetical protein